MSFPKPRPGLVIRYAYLWAHESDAGREEGIKDRPCAVALTTVRNKGGTDVIVLPVTHAPPQNSSDAIEIPAPVKEHLGLDSSRSWIVMTEANLFTWPGPDLRPAKNGDLNTIVCGILPPAFFSHVRNKYLAFDERRKTKIVKRTE